MLELSAVHEKYNTLLYESESTEEEITREIETDDGYRNQYLTAKLTFDGLLEVRETTAIRPVSVNATHSVKWPHLELPKFGGNIKDWLGFWSQFKKIHEDSSLSKEDKIQYLQQTMVPDSRAHDLVKSFPPVGENYDKVIQSLKSRFGKDEMVVEFYVRELLGLVLKNAMSNDKKPSLSHIYDKVESYIRALETLGVTTGKCAAMLYPLVESSLPEDILRAWQRSGRRSGEEEVQGVGVDNLTRLLKFLQIEVENEQRIDMALSGFHLPTEQQKANKKTKAEPSKDVASASALLVRDEKIKDCVFCNGAHESKTCEAARKFTLDERKEKVKKARGCFKCMRRGHSAKICRARVKCDWCGYRHELLMCQAAIQKENGTVSNTAKSEILKEHSLTTLCDFQEVCLQTLRIKIYNDKNEFTVRAVIDTASQRSYVRADIAKALNYESVGEKDIVHALFGGANSDREKHNIFLVKVKNLKNSYACNFTALEQKYICSSIPGIKDGKIIKELRDLNIELSDWGNKSDSIEVLIGADIAGKLLTGITYQLENGLTAIETLLGWTVMGKLPVLRPKSDTALMLMSMFVKEASLSDLWSLETLGISDPILKKDKALTEAQTQEFLLKTSKLNSRGHYEVRLPWIADHAPIGNNFEISRNRLKRTIEKLKGQGLFDNYDAVFKEWLAEGIIERVESSCSDGDVHYLPHRPVIKAQGTTKIRPVFDASAHAQGYPSINQCLEKGPNLIELLTACLNRFREGDFGVIADIAKAFLQIFLREEERDFLRFLWVEDEKLIIF